MANCNKVVIDGVTKIDLTGDSVTAADVAEGKTFHDASGTQKTGTKAEPKLQSKSVTYTSNGTATVTPDSGYDGLSKANVTVDVSASAKTCSIDLSVSGYAYVPSFNCLKLNTQGNIVGFSDLCPNGEVSISSVLTDSLFVVCTKDSMSVEVYGGVSYLSDFAYFDTYIYLFKTPSNEGVTGQIYLY